MWPFAAYPEVSPSEINGRTYDYIVVGGGTAGCCIGSRLSEDPSVSVLVIEKGHVKDNFVSRVPLMSQNFWMGDTLQARRRFSEAMPNVNSRRNGIWTAEGLGGASRINGMLVTRGVAGGYNEWADKYGLDEWNWSKVEPFFRKSENAIAHPTSAWRGHGGPIQIRQPDTLFKWCKYTEKAARRIGLPVENDVNKPDAPAMGLFRMDMAIDSHGSRVSSYKSFLSKRTACERQGHLTICTGAVVSRLKIDNKAGLVHGVHIRPADGQAGGSDTYVHARREVIICSGTICTPQILMLSGIGPAKHLAAHDIPVLKELPVGATLQDHCSVGIMLELPKSETLSFLESIWGLWHILLWIFLGKGMMAASATPQSIFIRTSTIDDDTMTIDTKTSNMDGSQPHNIPDAEIMIMPVGSFERAIPGHSLLTFFPTLVQPLSRGSIELADRDPLASPRIYHPMLRDAKDLVPFRRAIRFAMRFAEEFQQSGYPYPAPLTFAPGVNLDMLSDWEKTAPNADELLVPSSGYTFASKVDAKPKAAQSLDRALTRAAGTVKTWKGVTDDEIDDYIKRVGMCSMHISSSCPMSKDSISGVVDQQLRVHGIKNLRIADASVFPKVISNHTMAPTIMVAERCADFIKEEWSNGQTS